MIFKEWWDKTAFSCGLPLHKSTARSAWEAATLAERERCAKVCDGIADKLNGGGVAKMCAEAIRKGDQP